MHKRSSRKIHASIKYCRGFMKVQSKIEGKAIWTAIQNAKTASLRKLPNTPQEIEQETAEMLPFHLPIQNRMQTGVIVNTLRLIFQFEQLLLSYFVQLPTLLTNYRNLRDEVRDLFLITKRFELSNLSYYRRKLALYYEVNKIPESFFELLLPKLP